MHPPLVRQLGSNLAQLTRERDASLVSATHSAEFLMGFALGAADLDDA